VSNFEASQGAEDVGPPCVWILWMLVTRLAGSNAHRRSTPAHPELGRTGASLSGKDAIRVPAIFILFRNSIVDLPCNALIAGTLLTMRFIAFSGGQAEST
jgi:hypothetical protein